MNADGDKLPAFVKFGCSTYQVLQKFDANLAISKPHNLKVFLHTLESSKYRGSTVLIIFPSISIQQYTLIMRPDNVTVLIVN